MSSTSKILRPMRFAVLLPDTGEAVSASQVRVEGYPSPGYQALSGDSLVITRGHILGVPSLYEIFAAQVARGTCQVDVYILHQVVPDELAARKFSYTYSAFNWRPLDLDATDGGVAFDTIYLLSATPVGPSVDLSLAELPATLQPDAG